MDRYALLDRKFKNCETVLGTQMTVTYSTVMLEKLNRDDLDFMLFDMEHGIYNPENLVPLLQVTRLLGLPNIVRVPAIEYAYIARVMDLGADCIMIPRTETVEQVKTAIDAMRFYPIGKTGIGGHGQFKAGEGIDDYQKSRHLIVQIESPTGLANLPAMLETYGDEISSVMIGPYDFSIIVGEPSNVLGEVCLDYYKQVFDICKSYKKSCGIYCPDERYAKVYKEIGAEVFWFSADLNFMVRGYNDTMDAVKALF